MKNISEILSLDELMTDLQARGFPMASPIDLEKIAEIYGITIDDAPRFDSKNFLGKVDGNTIWVNPKDANEYMPLRRHVIAHELAHIVLHKPVSGSPMYFQDSYDDIRSGGTSVAENEANAFAAALLIPENSLVTLIQEEAPKRKETGTQSAIFKMIALEFDVPVSLAIRRVVDLAKARQEREILKS